MKYFIKVFGCQMNYSDAERISTCLEKLGLEPAFNNGAADSPAKALASAGLVVFVTCGVRQMAEDRVYGQIHNVRKKYPQKKIMLTGCLAHRKDVQQRLKDKVDLFATIKDFPQKIFESGIRNQELWGKIKNHNSKFIIHNSKNKPCNDYLELKPRYVNSYIAYVPIMTGCDNFCAYCVVPYARGREYSRPADEILREVKSLVKKGRKEIILLGQNVNSYCESDKNSSPEASAKGNLVDNFPKLLKLIEKIPGKFWITFLTSHPKDMSDELIETIAKSKKICEYISLPAQSGDDEILRRMNRKYTIEHYKNLIKKIRLAFAEVRPSASADCGPTATARKLPPAISTDIIVGFPSETKKQFAQTAKLMREAKFDMAYIAQYSPRPETAAWKWKDNISKIEKERREKVLTKILKKTALENNRKYIGRIVEILIDKKIPNHPDSPNLPKKYLGHTRTQKKVIFHSNKKIPIGSFVEVKIKKVKAFGLEGKYYE